MKSMFAAAAILAFASPAFTQVDFTTIDSGSILSTRGNIDSALTGINTGTIDRNTGISLDSDNNTLVQFVRNGGSPFGDYLLKYDLDGATGPTAFGGNLDDADTGDNDLRTGNGGLGIAAGNGLAVFYDFENGAGDDEFHAFAISDGSYTLIEENADLGGTRLFEHVTGTIWITGRQTSFGGDGTLRLYDAATADITNAPVLATATDPSGVFDIDVVEDGGDFSAYFVQNDEIWVVTDITGTPGAPTNVTPAGISSIPGLTIQDMVAIDSDTFVVFDSGNLNIVVSDAGVVTTYSFADIATATGASGFTLDPFFIYDHIEKRLLPSGDVELYITNNAAYSDTSLSNDAAIVVITFASAPQTNVQDWTLYN